MIRQHSIDILYVAHNREAFTEKTLDCLYRNTDFFLVDRIYLYDDQSEDGARRHLEDFRTKAIDWFGARPRPEDHVVIERGSFGGPVAVMNHFIDLRKPKVFVKVDSDTAVPHGWLNVLAATADAHQQFQLIGMECMSGPAVEACTADEWEEYLDPSQVITARSVDPSTHIGGIGLMRGGAFQSPDRPSPAGKSGRFGFTEWQHRCQPARGWLTPGLPIALLDRVPIEPWASLSADYVAKGWQREWPKYSEADRHIWGWLDD